jgi:hypothetical protein
MQHKYFTRARFFPHGLPLFIFGCVPLFMITALDLPLEFHGSASVGKYLNSDTIRYNMDASIDLYVTLVRHKGFSFFGRYRDELDMAEQKGGVSLDPRYAHYYIVGGFDYMVSEVFCALYFMHDCIHDIDFEVEGTPVFNRLRFMCASADMHANRRLMSRRRFQWALQLGVYPHLDYSGWDINSGADYQYDIIFDASIHAMKRKSYGLFVDPHFHITKGDTMLYHQHSVRAGAYAQSSGGRIGLAFTYHVWNNDIIKDPDKLWLFSLLLEF